MGQRSVEYRYLDDLKGNPDNAKRHDTAGIAASMGRFGMVDLVVIDDRTGWLVAGHGRVATLQEARAAGREPPAGVRADDQGWQVPTVVGWASDDDDEALATTVALNRWTERGGWDIGGLIDRLDHLADTPAGIDALGFSNSDLDDLMAQHQEATTDDPDDDWQLNERQVRSFMFDLPIEDYRWAVAVAARARDHYEVDSNAALFLAMLEEDATEATA